MSAPEISDLALTTVDIDPFVEYTYTIPVTEETSLGFEANENFDLSIAGKVLTLQYTGGFTDAAETTAFQVTLFASNSDGTTELVITFRVGPYSYVQRSATHAVSATSGSPDLSFGSAIGDQLRVNDKVKLDQVGGSGGTFDGVTRYVVAVSGSNFQVSATLGGSAINAGATLNYVVAFPLQTTGETEMYVGDTSGLAVNDPITLAHAPAVSGAYPLYTSDPAFVKEIVDDYHIKVAATPGGTAVAATADLHLITQTADDVIFVRTFPRQYPVITSDHFLTVTPRETVAYAITEDVAPDLYQVKGLPVELRLVDDDIVGVAPDSGYYPITIMARLGLGDSLRQLVLIVDET